MEQTLTAIRNFPVIDSPGRLALVSLLFLILLVLVMRLTWRKPLSKIDYGHRSVIVTVVHNPKGSVRQRSSADEMHIGACFDPPRDAKGRFRKAETPNVTKAC